MSASKMPAPPNFVLTKRSTLDRPPLNPPGIVKPQIYTDPECFKEVDDHAIAVAKVKFTNFRDLIWNLVFKKDFNELQRARYSGLHCIKVCGWLKGQEYKLGEPITGPGNHFWNAIFIDGNWQLIDTYGGTGSDPHSYRDFYFLPEPEKLIYTHFPDEDSRCQLCNRIVSKAEFEGFVELSSHFFEYGLQLIQQKQGVVYSHNGILVLTLGLTLPIELTNDLIHSVTEENDKFDEEVRPSRFVIQETTDNRISFYIRIPQEGIYFLKVFAGPLNSIDLEKVCTFKIVCEKKASGAKPFNTLNYGPGVEIKRYGLTPSQQAAILQTTDGFVEVFFTKSRPVRLSAYINDERIQIEHKENSIIVKCKLPDPGEYELEVFAKDLDTWEETSYLIFRYLVVYTDEDIETLYGKVYDQYDSQEICRYDYSLEKYEALVNMSHMDISGTSSSENSVKTLNRSTFSCPICMDDDEQMREAEKHIVSTKCGHLFCGECLNSALAKDSSRPCPTCRAFVNAEDIHRIFLP